MFYTLAPNAYLADQAVPIVRNVSENLTETAAVTHADRFRQIRVGRVVYNFKRPMHGFYDVYTLTYIVEGLAITGEDVTPYAARCDWAKRFHVRFQELYAKRPFEMDDDEKAEWDTFFSVVDVYEYTNRTPVKHRMIGQLIRKERVFRVRWMDGRNNSIEYADVPPELAGLTLGRWFEAVAERDPRTGELLRLDMVTPVPTPPRAGSNELMEFLESIPKTSEYPETEV